jgi:hypothetical protein
MLSVLLAREKIFYRFVDSVIGISLFLRQAGA